MALGQYPSLTQINTELGTTGQKLSTCIANANKTGTWDRQSDFAYYSHITLTAFSLSDDYEYSWQDACDAGFIYLTRWHDGAGTYPIVGDTVYTNSDGSTVLNGSGQWWHSDTSDSSYEINTTGVVLTIRSC